MLTSQDIDFFIHLASNRSLAATARKLNVTPPSISQRLNLLEKKLAVKLVERGARSIALTAAGEILVEQGKGVMLDLGELENSLQNNKVAISGKIKVLAPLGFGTQYIAPIVAEFQNRHPLTEIDLILSDNPQWSEKHSPDVMIYIGNLKDSSLKRIFLANNKRLLLASPDYLASAPSLNHPNDLKDHQCIALRENEEDVTLWKFSHRLSTQKVAVRFSPALSSNVGLVIKNWAVDARGIIQRSEWDVVKELKTGELVNILPDYQLSSADIVALVSTSREKRPQKINDLIDFCKQSIEERIRNEIG
jgi:DNA-binding transcriptional LysR family regulator